MNRYLMAVAVLCAGFAFGAGLENEYVSIAFGEKGEIASIRDKASGRELVKTVLPFAEVTLKDGRKIEPVGFGRVGVPSPTDGDGLSPRTAVERRPCHGRGRDGARPSPDRLVWSFPGGGELELSSVPFAGGWTFRIERFTVSDAVQLELFRIGSLACDKWVGSNLRMISDEADGVVLMAYDLKLGMAPKSRWDKSLFVTAYDDFGFTGWRFGFTAGAKGKLREALKAMTVATGIPYTKAGGAWGLDSDLNRGSYVFSYTELAALDDWIDVCRRAGSMYLHMHIWYRNQGHYQVNERKFPGGIAGMREATDRLHAAGIRPSMHTLTACIAYDDPYVTPVPTDDLQVTYRYTLAAPLDEQATEMTVNEKPGDLQAHGASYSSRGTFVRIGKEIVSYSDFTTEKPYVFKGLRRGALGTRVAAHAVGEKADYLTSRYSCFFPEPESPTAAAIGRQLAKVYSEAGIERVFLDGSEGISWSDYSDRGCYKINRMLKTIFDSIDQSERPAKIDSSCGSRHGWWYHACNSPWDIGIYGHKFFADDRAACAVCRETDFMQPQIGWIGITTANKDIRGITEDDIEYYATRMIGVDAPTGVQRVDVNRKPLDAWISHQLTVLGWYDRFRTARVFAPGIFEACAVKDSDYHLAQVPNGEWRIAPATRDVHRINGREDCDWMVSMPAKPAAAKLRLEAFYGCSRYQDAADNVVFSAKDAAKLRVKTAPKVKLSVSTGRDRRRGETLILEGENKSGTLVGSWAGATLEIPRPFLNIAPADGVGFWVKGDGSGATLDVQLGAGVTSDHLVTLDFEGWRYFEFLFRERDLARVRLEKWPFSTGWNQLKSVMRTDAIKTVAFYLNSIPGAGTEANVFMDENITRSAAEIAAGGAKVEISEVRAIDREFYPLNNAKFTINGRKLKVPFDSLEAGDFAELADGVWTLRDEKGGLKEVVSAEAEIRLREGPNRIRFAANTYGANVRAEVRLIGYGESVPALGGPGSVPAATDATERVPPWSSAQRQALAYEAMLPVEFAPAKGVASLPPILVRPNERARLDVTIYGPVKNPALVWDGGRAAFPVALKAGERLFCRDGRNWRTIDGNRKELAKGALAQPLPMLNGGANKLDFDCDDREDSEVRLDFVKNYTR